MAEVADLFVTLRGVSGPFVKSMEEASTAASGTSKKIESVMAANKKIALGTVAGAALIGVAAVRMASDYQTQLTRLYTAAGGVKSVILANSNEILRIATSVNTTGQTFAEALYHPISAGLSFASALQVVKYAAQEAAISGANLDDTTYALSSVMKAFNLPTSAVGVTMAKLNAIVGDGDMRFQDFNESIKNWTPTAAAMGISIQSMGAGLAYLTDRAMPAEVASTRMTMGLTMMTTPTARATKLLVAMGLASTSVKASSEAMRTVLEKTGISQSQLAMDLKRPDGLYVALSALKDKLKEAGVSGTEADSVLARIFGGGRTDKAAMSLMQNLAGVKQKYDQIGRDSTAQKFTKDWTDAQQTFAQRAKNLGSWCFSQRGGPRSR